MTPFKLACASLTISARDAALLLGIPFDTVRKYYSGERPTPSEVMKRLRVFFLRVDDAAQAYCYNPARLANADLPKMLMPAAMRRIQEIDFLKNRRGKLKTPEG